MAVSAWSFWISSIVFCLVSSTRSCFAFISSIFTELHSISEDSHLLNSWASSAGSAKRGRRADELVPGCEAVLSVAGFPSDVTAELVVNDAFGFSFEKLLVAVNHETTENNKQKVSINTHWQTVRHTVTLKHFSGASREHNPTKLLHSFSLAIEIGT